MNTPRNIDAKLVRRLEREYSRAIRAEENAATLAQAYRLAAASERCLRRLQAAQIGLSLPEPRTPRTARNLAKQGFAALAALGRAIARAVNGAAALRKAQAALAVRKVARAAARAVRAALRRAGRTVAVRALALVALVVTTKKEIIVMKSPKLAARITVTRNFGHSGVAIDGRVLGFFDMDGPEGAPERFRLGCWLINDRFVFKGGIGEHSIAADELITNAARLIAHWNGYVDNTVRAFAEAAHKRVALGPLTPSQALALASVLRTETSS